MRIDCGNGDSVPTTIDDIEPGDFIASIDCPICVGKVLGRASIHYGAESIPGFLIVFAAGRREFVSEDDTRILGWGR